ncbi:MULTISPECIES: RNA polymerase factor sigma-54 [unclassified Rhizobacter]|uniref:RNA polymerase factor sigma-54 n=1 Tax=unclassified Rhizobacter TaxID=2640088 RepID=UPI0006FA3101|nr:MULTISPECIES: RNA polymerase factor sigma-54 [unclassified Rhizobacter]KQU76815.1 RNA polymerase sigma-54 factor [Rhizobacter sp. Root29]KQV97335.1 RNA polymerase sigma-54 factor [Rhizobacter sp. Root1238]KRB10007.1 RNA polymerase sigma-54 factor [Rhizobacter sp. Root16D2]
MKPSLQVRLSQHLALTPQLQQSIRLLQLSTLELHQEVEQMLEQNPFLEAEQEEAGATEPMVERLTVSERNAERETESSSASESSADSAPDEAAGVDSAEFGATEREDWENGTERDDFDGIRETPSAAGSGSNADDDFDGQDRNPQAPSLQEHLREQLLGMRVSAEDAAAITVLIESLDDDGYLADPLEEIATELAADPEQQEEILERLQCALKWLQNMEPLGVGARNLGECLTLQLRAQERCEAQMIAIIICKQHLDLLARRDMKKLMAATGADEELIKEAQTLIVALEPKPGRPFARAEANIIVPDVIVQKSGRNWKVVLNPDVMPKLRINDLYAQAIRQGRGAGGGSALSSRLQEARWFMKNIQQRFDTIQRVSQAIVERQKSFFTHGEIAMKPLVLREIADELGLHESTISRVTTAKYMATMFGTFELKYFFGSSLNTEAGGNASSTAVRALIKQLVSAEDPVKPLSDSQLSHMLEEQGIQVARRTVAKYREALKIAPANLRKSL